MSVNRYNASTGELINIASGQRTWVGTKEAYKSAKQAGALPNNAMIVITNDEQDHNHYSTEETETGMYWIDGKPIYRKVFNITKSDSSQSMIIPYDILNLKEIVNWHGVSFENNGMIRLLPFTFYNNESYTIGISLYGPNSSSSANNILLQFGSTVASVTAKIYITLEYTKTTD